MIGTSLNQIENAFSCQVSTCLKWCVLNVNTFNYCEIFPILGRFVPSFQHINKLETDEKTDGLTTDLGLSEMFNWAYQLS